MAADQARPRRRAAAPSWTGSVSSPAARSGGPPPAGAVRIRPQQLIAGCPVGVLGRGVPLQAPGAEEPAAAALDGAAPLLPWLPGVMEAKHGIRLGEADLQAGGADQRREQALDVAEGPGEGPADRTVRPRSAPPMLKLVFDEPSSVVPSREVGSAPWPPSVSRTRVRNQRRPTSPVTGFCNGSRHGTPARLRPRLHHRPATPASDRRPSACRLLPGLHRDRQRRPHRPAHPRPGPGPAASRRHPGRWKLDRLGRSLRHLVDAITSLAERGIGFRSLQEAIPTTTPDGKVVFHVFAALAEFERDLIRERTTAGLAAARARGPARAWPSLAPRADCAASSPS
jgi:hypothetical protein